MNIGGGRKGKLNKEGRAIMCARRNCIDQYFMIAEKNG